MPLRPPAGFRSAFYDPLKVADAPTAPAASGGDAQASVTFTAPSNVGGSAITQYYAVSNPNQITGNAASSPITVTGLTNGTAYTFRVWALNSFGPSPYSGVSGSVSPVATRGLFGGGQNSVAETNVIQYITVSTTGNALDFGDLSGGGYNAGMVSCSSSTRAIWRYGSTMSTSIVYSTILTLGNTTAFGDLTSARSVVTSLSNSTRGLFAGGATGAGNNTIDYITIATTGNAADFGDTTFAYWSGSGACASSTRGIVEAAGIQSGSTEVNTVDYVTIATTGNAVNFGQLTQSRYGLAGSSSSTRGIFGGGYVASYVNTIDYITIATTGNGTDFGDLTVSRGFLSACSSSTRGLFGGGSVTGAVRQNVMDYVTIASTGNATDFGDLLAETSSLAACSSGHGGLS